MRNPSRDDKAKLTDQWQADVSSLETMIVSMQNEIDAMREAKAPPGHIEFRQEMITQYETTISKLQALINEN